SERWQKPAKTFILNILENEFGLAGLPRPDLDDVGRAYAAPGGFWLAIDGGKIIGTIGLMDAGNGRAYLKRWYVEKNRRGHCIGTRLVARFREHAAANGFKRIFIATGPTMERVFSFYERSGFLRIPALPPGMPRFNDSVFFEGAP
ncbi:MAG: GNAT family N-acetyltransferase, partial [Candidatus Micrarchaeota archaeon]|nr:GNAT family N-acetyltransferase [Candidatus Micrarchaeota archaeon]